MKKINWFYLIAFIVFLSTCVYLLVSTFINSNNENINSSIKNFTSLDDSKKESSKIVNDITNKKKRVLYNGKDVTYLFDNIPTSKKEISDIKKMEILKELKITFKENLYEAYSEKNANYDGFDLGNLKFLSEANINQLKLIMGFRRDLLKVENQNNGIIETRKAKYELCKPVFNYWNCDLENLVEIPYIGYGKMEEGKMPNHNLEDEEVFSYVFNNYPNFKNDLVGSILYYVISIGIGGKPKTLGDLFYNNENIFSFTEEISNFEEIDSSLFLEIFSNYFDENKFTPYLPPSFPTYKNIILEYLEKGKELNELTIKEKLKILGFNEEVLIVT